MQSIEISDAAATLDPQSSSGSQNSGSEQSLEENKE